MPYAHHVEVIRVLAPSEIAVSAIGAGAVIVSANDKGAEGMAALRQLRLPGKQPVVIVVHEILALDQDPEVRRLQHLAESRNNRKSDRESHSLGGIKRPEVSGNKGANRPQAG